MTAQPQPVSIEGLTPEAAAAVVKLSRNLANSKDINDRIQFYDLAQKADPGISVPTDVQLERFKRDQKASADAIDIENKKNAALAAQEKARKSLIETGRYDEATVKKIEDEVMTPRGISDYEVAATLYAHANPAPDVRRPMKGEAGQTWEMPWEGQPKDNVTQLIKNPRKVALNKAHAVMSEIIRNRKQA